MGEGGFYERTNMRCRGFTTINNEEPHHPVSNKKVAQ
jgi:hypothetical protein